MSASDDPRVEILAAWHWGIAWTTASDAIRRGQRAMARDFLARLDAAVPAPKGDEVNGEGFAVRKALGLGPEADGADVLAEIGWVQESARLSGAVTADREVDADALRIARDVLRKRDVIELVAERYHRLVDPMVPSLAEKGDSSEMYRDEARRAVAAVLLADTSEEER